MHEPQRIKRESVVVNYFTEMCSGSEAGSYLRLIDILYHSTLGLRVIKKKRSFVGGRVLGQRPHHTSWVQG